MKKLDLLKLSKKIKLSSKKFSFDICRITDSNLDKIVQSNLKEYINLGYYGQMKWIRNTYDKRKSPKFLWEEAKSAIVLGMNYSPKSDPLLKLLNK